MAKKQPQANQNQPNKQTNKNDQQQQQKQGPCLLCKTCLAEAACHPTCRGYVDAI